MLHVTPFNVNEVGAGLLPAHEPLKPGLREAPGAIVGLYDSFTTVTLLPCCEKMPFHPCVTTWLLGKVKASVQPLIVVELVFVIVMLSVKPPGH